MNEGRLPQWMRERLADLRGFDVSRFPMQSALYVDAGLSWTVDAIEVTVRFVTRVRDRDDPEKWIDVVHQNSQLLRHVDQDFWTRGRALEWMRSTLQRAVVHELDECMLVGGERKWDPHAVEART